MKNLTSLYLLFLMNIIVFNVFSSQWMQITKGQNGHIFYVDMNTINEKRKYVFFWQLINYNETDEYGDNSARIYIKGSCETFNFKWLKVSYHKKKMAKDQSKTTEPSEIVAGWQIPDKGSTSFAVLDYVCKNKGVLL